MVLQLTTRTKHRIAIEPTLVTAIEETPNLRVSDTNITVTRLHTVAGISHDVLEPFDLVYNEWQAQIEEDEPETSQNIETGNKYEIR